MPPFIRLRRVRNIRFAAAAAIFFDSCRQLLSYASALFDCFTRQFERDASLPQRRRLRRRMLRCMLSHYVMPPARQLSFIDAGP